MTPKPTLIASPRLLVRYARRPSVSKHRFVTNESTCSCETHNSSYGESSNTLSDLEELKGSQISEKEGSHDKTQRTQEQLDKELQMKMAGLAGDGGEAGVELEGGKAVAMKRSVKANMFRYI